MYSFNRPTIVVGVSGSRASAAALRWAAEEARRRDARLVAVRAWESAQHAHYAVPAGHQNPEHLRQAVTWELAGTLRSAFGARLPGNLFTEVVEGKAERVLVDRSAGADVIVLGSTSSPGFSGRSIGPVIRSCLSRAHCPVVVIGPEGLGGNLGAEIAAGEKAADQNGRLLPSASVRRGRPSRQPVMRQCASPAVTS